MRFLCRVCRKIYEISAALFQLENWACGGCCCFDTVYVAKAEPNLATESKIVANYGTTGGTPVTTTATTSLSTLDTMHFASVGSTSLDGGASTQALCSEPCLTPPDHDASTRALFSKDKSSNVSVRAPSSNYESTQLSSKESSHLSSLDSMRGLFSITHSRLWNSSDYSSTRGLLSSGDSRAPSSNNTGSSVRSDSRPSSRLSRFSIVVRISTLCPCLIQPLQTPLHPLHPPR
jgi:hypothetical protein